MNASFQAAAGIVALAWVAVWALLQFEHAIWRALPFQLRYLMGMGTVCLGCLGAGIALDNLALAVVPGIIATSGLTILKSYYDESKADQDRANAQERGEVLGLARGIRKILSQEAIDRGDDPSRN